jgi:tRNA 2-thiocytidine biosynthesis protein TtcA
MWPNQPPIRRLLLLVATWSIVSTVSGKCNAYLITFQTITIKKMSSLSFQVLPLFRGRRSAQRQLTMSKNGGDDHNRVKDHAIEPIIQEPSSEKTQKLQSRLMKSLRDISLRYEMISPNDRIMVCISGGKDSATLLHLLIHLQKKLKAININFEVVAVHLNQMQPGYDNTSLIEWLDSLRVPYRIVTEDTYSIVSEKTPESKAYCSLCSRLRRGILYSIAHELNCNKIALGHHGDDAVQTLLLNMIHGGVMKGMPARYYSSSRDVHVLRPLISCVEKDIADFAKEMQFPILPCNLCGSQEDLHRGKAKLLVDAMETMNPGARGNVIRAMSKIKPSHLMDENLRMACGLDGISGVVVEEERAKLIGEKVYEQDESDDLSDDEDKIHQVHSPPSFIESLL